MPEPLELLMDNLFATIIAGALIYFALVALCALLWSRRP